MNDGSAAASATAATAATAATTATTATAATAAVSMAALDCLPEVLLGRTLSALNSRDLAAGVDLVAKRILSVSRAMPGRMRLPDGSWRFKRPSKEPMGPAPGTVAGRFKVVRGRIIRDRDI